SIHRPDRELCSREFVENVVERGKELCVREGSPIPLPRGAGQIFPQRRIHHHLDDLLRQIVRRISSEEEGGFIVSNELRYPTHIRRNNGRPDLHRFQENQRNGLWLRRQKKHVRSIDVSERLRLR